MIGREHELGIMSSLFYLGNWSRIITLGYKLEKNMLGML